MSDVVSEEPSDRLVLVLDPNGPVELTGLTGSFSALARMYERHYPTVSGMDGLPRLYVTRLSSGSIIAEIAPYAQIFAEAYPAIVATNTVGDFTKRLSDGLRAFCGMARKEGVTPPSKEDAQDLKEFIKPLAGKNGAELRVTHARYSKITKDAETVVEYNFSEAELNKAIVNIDRALSYEEDAPQSTSKMIREVLLVIDRASRSPGRSSGRATDWAKVPEVSAKALPTYFRQSAT